MDRPYILVFNHDRGESSAASVESGRLALLAIGEHRTGGRNIEGRLIDCSSPECARLHAEKLHPEYHFLTSIHDVTQRLESDPLQR